ncbi:MAG: isoaspartyl peptidase/L-asparaginase family protein [Janthinobacterium lividum]
MTTDHWTLLIHGGAGRFDPATMSAGTDAATRAGLDAALEAGGAVLAAGGPALDAVEAAVRLLEDHPAFNAGRGAALTATGGIELDAAIMDGAAGRAGAVAGVGATRHPVSLARAVMEHSPHVLFAGPGADAFALAQGLEQAAPDWFATPDRRAQLAELLSGAAAFDSEMKYGTVGAVARDVHGHLAAATSTGGVTGKRPGRVGDSPLIGAGTWAEDAGLAVSCTGSGEQFVRAAAAAEASARVRLLGEPVAVAVAAALDRVRALGGTGGMIALDAAGRSAWRFATPGMNRGLARSDGTRGVAIHGDEFTGQRGADG